MTKEKLLRISRELESRAKSIQDFAHTHSDNSGNIIFSTDMDRTWIIHLLTNKPYDKIISLFKEGKVRGRD